MPRLADSLDMVLARVTRAVRALGDPALASRLESALIRSGRLEEAYLLRWRRGEPSPTATAVAATQRPVLAALEADLTRQIAPCATCGPLGCGPPLPAVATGPGPAASRWTTLGAGHPLPLAPVVGAKRVRLPHELEALASLGTLAELRLSSTALRPDAPLPSTVEALTVWLGDAGDVRLGPHHVAGLTRLRSLELSGRLTDEQLDGLLRACGRGLERLVLDAPLLTDLGLEALAQTPDLRDLALVDAAWLDGSGFRALADVEAPLRRFSLHGAARSTWRTLDAVGSFETLEEVDLEDVAVDHDDDGFTELATLPRLRRFRLAGGRVAPGAFDELREVPLEAMTLARTGGVDDRVLEACASSTTLRELTLRDLEGPTGRGWGALAHAPRLEVLTIDRCAVDTEALVGLARSAALVELAIDPLSMVAVTEACAAIGRMTRLKRLSLAGLLCTLAGTDALVAAGSRLSALVLERPGGEPLSQALLGPVARLQGLEQLSVFAPIPPGAVASLAGAPRLRELTLSGRVMLDDVELHVLCTLSTLRVLRLPCVEAERLRIAATLPGVDVQPAW